MKLLGKKGMQTCKIKYGDEYPQRTESCKEKIRKTNIQRRGVPYPMMDSSVLEKAKQTLVIKLGVDRPQKSMMVRKKTEQTCLNKYGTKTPLQNKEIKIKAQNTLRTNYGVDHPNQSKEILDRVRRTNMEKRGVYWHTQSKEYHKTAHKRYTNPKYPEMTFDSSWEFKVYDFLTENHIEFEYQPSITFEYEFDGKIHTYHPDFKVGDKIYEVKGNQFFRINKDTGIEEMCAPPYDRNHLTDEEYEYKCLCANAKYLCMMKNGVTLLRKKDIRDLKVVFGKQYCNSNTRIIK